MADVADDLSAYGVKPRKQWGLIQAVEQYALDCVVCIREHVTGGGPSAMAVCSAHRSMV